MCQKSKKSTQSSKKGQGGGDSPNTDSDLDSREKKMKKNLYRDKLLAEKLSDDDSDVVPNK